MKLQQVRATTSLAAVLSFLGGALVPRANGDGVTYEHWKLDGDRSSATGGSALLEGFSKPATAAGLTFANDQIAGESVPVAVFERGTILRLNHRFAPNGGGAFVNQYTLLIDVRFDGRPSGWSALWQTDPQNRDATDWAVNGSGALGSVGSYGGKVVDGAWNRLVLVVDAAAGSYTSYINGRREQELYGLETDGRYALRATAWLFADSAGFNSAGRVADIQLRNYAMNASEVAALGVPKPGGFPVVTAPSLTFTRPPAGGVVTGGVDYPIRWTTENSRGSVRVTYGAEPAGASTLGTVPMSDGQFIWQIPPWHPDRTGQRVYLSDPATGLVLGSSEVFRIEGTQEPLSPGFEAPLGTNLGFEDALAGWRILSGRPWVTTGNAHGGQRYLHGGVQQPGDAIVRQEIDLAAAGFREAEMDDAPTVQASAWLRVETGSGIFDDQAFHRVVFLSADGTELGSVRSLIADSWNWLPLEVSGPAPTGTRRLALEMIGRHRRGPDNEACADDFAVRLVKPWPTAKATITKQPFLQDVRPDAMTLFWETDANPVWPLVEWGRGGALDQVFTRIETLQVDATHFVHRATLTGLETETEYSYRVRNGTVASPVYVFRTAPRRETPFVTAWWGDNHQGTTVLKQHVANLMAHGPDLICVAGDMVNSGNSLEEWHNYWFKPLEHLRCAQTTPVVFARGNHDAEHAFSYAYSKLPGNEAWFAFDFGNSRFVFLDSEANDNLSPEQLSWLRAELARPGTRQAAFRIVCFHRPPWCQLWNGGGHTGDGWVREAWVPLFREAGVDLVVCGHEHDYHRGRKDDVIYVVSGGGGGTPDTERVANWSHVQVESTKHHFDLMSVNGRTLGWETFDTQNRLLDSFVLQSRVPALALQRGEATGAEWKVRIEGRENLRYVLESSTDFATWSPVATRVVPDGATYSELTLPDTPGPRYLRARWGGL